MRWGQEREGTKVLWLRILRSKDGCRVYLSTERTTFRGGRFPRVSQALVARVGNPISFFVCFDSSCYRQSTQLSCGTTSTAELEPAATTNS